MDILFTITLTVHILVGLGVIGLVLGVGLAALVNRRKES